MNRRRLFRTLLAAPIAGAVAWLALRKQSTPIGGPDWYMDPASGRVWCYCDVCGKPGNESVADMIELTLPGDQWVEWMPTGVWRFGCEDHPVSGRELGVSLGLRRRIREENKDRPLVAERLWELIREEQPSYGPPHRHRRI